MSRRPDESLKTTAMELARLLYTGSRDMEAMTTLLKQLPGATQLPVTPDTNTGNTNNTGDEVGIWKLTVKNGKPCYERDAAKKDEWAYWADTHRFFPHDGSHHIVLLGESVARGYLYDPHYTVAKELEAILCSSTTLKNAKVTDLAKTSMGMDELLATARSCVALRPDAVVFFAGNNWIPKLYESLTQEDYRQLHDLFLTACFDGVKSFLEEKLRLLVIDFLKEVEQCFIARNIPVLFIIPAFNLADWRSDEVEQMIPWLPGDQITGWMKARENAERAMANNNAGELAAFAKAMVSIDPGNPLGQELLANAYLISNEYDKAAVCLEAARDAALFRRGDHTTPRCPAVVSKTIQAHAAQYGIGVLDSHEIFRRQCNGYLPGRTVFLDYCHLTVQGIKWLMHPAAHWVYKTITSMEMPAGTADSGCTVPEQVQGIAHFCAAIHNAHNGQSAEIINFHCQHALQLSDSVQAMMRLYLDFSNRRVPSVFCKSFEEIVAGGYTRQYEGGLGFNHPRNGKLADIELSDAIVRALRPAGVHCENELKELRRQAYAIGTDGVDLLDSFFHRSSYNRFITAPEPGFRQFHNSGSRFYFMVPENQSLSFRLVYRTPNCNDLSKTIRLFLNHPDNLIAEIPVSKNWQSFSCTLSMKTVQEGINQLWVNWPPVTQPFGLKGKPSLYSLTQAMFPALGEIYALSVAAVPGKKRTEEKAASIDLVAEK